MSVFGKFLIACCLVVTAFAVGCGDSRPDPRANPDFNEAAMEDPMSVKMDTP
jgi:hypothetical protein